MTERRPLLTAAALADYIGASPDWARTLLADGTIPGGRKVRGRWRVEQADVDAWLDAGRPVREEDPDAVPYVPFPRAMTRTVTAA